MHGLAAEASVVPPCDPIPGPASAGPLRRRLLRLALLVVGAGVFLILMASAASALDVPDVDDAVAGATDTVTATTDRVLDTVGDTTAAAAETVEATGDTAEAVVATVSETAETVAGAADFAVGTVSEAAETVVATAETAVGTMSKAAEAVGTASEAVSGATSTSGGLLDEVGSAVDTMLGPVVDEIQPVVGAVRAVTNEVGDLVPGLPGGAHPGTEVPTSPVPGILPPPTEPGIDPVPGDPVGGGAVDRRSQLVHDPPQAAIAWHDVEWASGTAPGTPRGSASDPVDAGGLPFGLDAAASALRSLVETGGTSLVWAILALLVLLPALQGRSLRPDGTTRPRASFVALDGRPG